MFPSMVPIVHHNKNLVRFCLHLLSLRQKPPGDPPVFFSPLFRCLTIGSDGDDVAAVLKG